MNENHSPHYTLRSQSRTIDSQIIVNYVKRGYRLSQSARSPIEMVLPVELDFVSKKLGSECRLLRVKAIKYLFKHVFQSPEEVKWGELHLIRQIRDRLLISSYGDDADVYLQVRYS
jgi:hypothetical protein